MRIMEPLLSQFTHPLYVMAKPAGSACNLACRYCYYLEKEKLYQRPERGGRLLMSDEVLEDFIRMYIQSQTTQQVQFCWHGGEAGLNYLCAGYKKFFSHVAPVMARMAEEIRKSGKL